MPTGRPRHGRAGGQHRPLEHHRAARLRGGRLERREPHLDDDEVATAVGVVRRAAVGKTVIAGTGRQSTQATIRLTKACADAGADLALVVNPSFFPGSLTAEVLAAHYVAVADASPIPILIYNVPKFTHLNIPVAAVARAATHPNIVGIKDSAGDIGQIIELLRACPSDFAVLLGNSPAFLSGLQVGATGAFWRWPTSPHGSAWPSTTWSLRGALPRPRPSSSG